MHNISNINKYHDISVRNINIAKKSFQNCTKLNTKKKQIWQTDGAPNVSTWSGVNTVRAEHVVLSQQISSQYSKNITMVIKMYKINNDKVYLDFIIYAMGCIYKSIINFNPNPHLVTACGH